MTWQEVKGDLHLWGGDDEPLMFTGTFLGFAAGKYGPDTNFKVKRDRGPSPARIETWNCPAVLRQRLAEVEVGSQIKIEHTGWITTKGGQQAMNFAVFVNQEDASVVDATQLRLPI